MRTRLAFLLLIVSVGCSGEGDDPKASRDESSNVKEQVEVLKKQNEEASARLAQLEADKARREAEERTAEQARLAEEKRLEELREAKRKLAETEAAIAAEEERLKQLDLIVAALPPEHRERLERVGEQTKAGTVAQEDLRWATTLMHIGEKLAKKEPLDANDLNVLRSVDLEYWGTKDGSILHLYLRAIRREDPVFEEWINQILHDHAPKLGLDRERTATFGHWLAKQDKGKVYEIRFRLRNVVDMLASGRMLPESELAFIRGIPALNERVAQYENALADPKQFAAMYDNEAKAWRVALQETLDRIEEATRNGDTETARDLQGQLDYRRERIIEYEQKAKDARAKIR